MNKFLLFGVIGLVMVPCLLYLHLRSRSIDVFLSKYEGPIFDWDIPILAVEHNLSNGKVRAKLKENGYHTHIYWDELTHFIYYIKDGGDILLASEFAVNGTITIFDNVWIEESLEHGFYIWP